MTEKNTVDYQKLQKYVMNFLNICITAANLELALIGTA